MPTHTLETYRGTARRLLLAFDIGTTCSGISYSILEPGQIPEIRPVTRFPSQERVGGDTKIPTAIYYDRSGKPSAIGAETLVEGIEADAVEKGWTKAHWFKLHLRPQPEKSSRLEDSDPVPPLPPTKTVIEVFADYIQYLHQCSKRYIQETHYNGPVLWESLEHDAIYALTHPNGWGGSQQAQMREAAILAGVVPDTDQGLSRITFVTEGEASLLFCLSSGLKIAGDKENSGVTIVDAGGGTIDVSSYRKINNNSFEEIAIPGCYFQGASYVTMRAEQYLKDRLSGSRFQDDLATIVGRFDRNTKHIFRSTDDPLHIQFASHRERDPELNIRAGRLTIAGDVVAKFFEPSVFCIVEAIKVHLREAHCPIRSVFLVGGFSASTWLYEKVKEAIEPMGVTISRPDSHINKAVSNGAISYYVDGTVKARVSRLNYGIKVFTKYDPSNAAHKARAHLAKPHPVHGGLVMDDKFTSILPKNARVKEATEFRRHFWYCTSEMSELKEMEDTILAYCGTSSKPPVWTTDDPDNFSVVCTVKADTSSVKPQVLYSEKTKARYYKVDYDIVLLFGLTELKAQIAYIENGVEKRGPAQVVYEP